MSSNAVFDGAATLRGGDCEMGGNFGGSGLQPLHDVIWSAIHLQCELLALGILIRGGITHGRTVHTDDILCGEGMLDAYELESKATIYPRLILAPKLIDKIKPQFSATFLSQDSDGLWFINPFSMGITPDHAEALLEDGYDPHEEALKTLGNLINQELLQLSDAGQLAKWGWLKTQHSLAVVEFSKLKQPRFWQMWRESEKSKPK